MIMVAVAGKNIERLVRIQHWDRTLKIIKKQVEILHLHKE
jgi:hypothetical protein